MPRPLTARVSLQPPRVPAARASTRWSHSTPRRRSSHLPSVSVSRRSLPRGSCGPLTPPPTLRGRGSRSSRPCLPDLGAGSTAPDCGGSSLPPPGAGKSPPPIPRESVPGAGLPLRPGGVASSEGGTARLPLPRRTSGGKGSTTTKGGSDVPAAAVPGCSSSSSGSSSNSGIDLAVPGPAAATAVSAPAEGRNNPTPARFHLAAGPSGASWLG